MFAIWDLNKETVRIFSDEYYLEDYLKFKKGIEYNTNTFEGSGRLLFEEGLIADCLEDGEELYLDWEEMRKERITKMRRNRK